MSNRNLSDFCKAICSFAELEAKLNQTSPDAELINKIKALSNGIFKIVVMGEIKKGKSSFVNALLGVENLVPVSSDVATSTIYKICYGEQLAYKVFFTEKSQKPSLEIKPSDLALYGTESGNPGNIKEVDFIQVLTPSSILKNGLVIIDTPGLGGLFKEHKRITYEYVPRADAVFLVTDSVESPIGKAELELLKDLTGITSHIYYIQTKSTVVDRKARMARKDNNLSILRNAGFGDVNLNYFVVDSKLKIEADEVKDIQDLNDSGFPLVMSLVEQKIKPNIRTALMEKTLLELRPRFDAVAAKLESRKKIISADTEEKRKALKQEIEEADRALQEWEKTKLPDLLDGFQKSFSTIKHDVEEKLNQCRPGGPINQYLDEKLNQAQSLADLQAVNAVIAENLPGALSECYLQVTRKVQADVENILRDFSLTQKSGSVDVVTQDDVQVLPAVSHSPINCAVEKCNSYGGWNFDSLRTGFAGCMAGATIATVLGGVVGSVIPVVGTVIGSSVGMMIAGYWGGNEALKLKNKHELEKGVQHMHVAVSQTLNNFYIETQRKIRYMLDQIMEDARSMLRKSIAEQRDALAARSRELISQSQSGISELDRQRKEIDDLSRRFQSILRFVS